jgi:hypothetical protein
VNEGSHRFWIFFWGENLYPTTQSRFRFPTANTRETPWLPTHQLHNQNNELGCRNVLDLLADKWNSEQFNPVSDEYPNVHSSFRRGSRCRIAV